MEVACGHEKFVFAHKNSIFPTTDFYLLFFKEFGRIGKNRFSKLHYRFRRNSSLIKTVLTTNSLAISGLCVRIDFDWHSLAAVSIAAVGKRTVIMHSGSIPAANQNFRNAAISVKSRCSGSQNIFREYFEKHCETW